MMYCALVMTGMFDSIEHYYLVPGHTFLPSDRNFGATEKKIRTTDYVFTPEDWFRLMEKSRVKNHFHIIRMRTEDFKNFHSATTCLVRNKKSRSGMKMPLQKTVVLRIESKNQVYCSTEPAILNFVRGRKYRCSMKQLGDHAVIKQ
jgi:hypothetical protein